MKGVIFTEFISLVEDKWGLQMINDIIDDTHDPVNGSYVSVGNYDHHQLVDLVVALHKRTGIPVNELLKAYGKALFERLVNRYGHFKLKFTSAFDLFMNLEDMIHTEVRKLLLDSNPPRFTCEQIDENKLKMHYYSHRCMGPVAEGLMHGCAEFFNEEIDVEVLGTSEKGDSVEYLLTKKP